MEKTEAEVQVAEEVLRLAIKQAHRRLITNMSYQDFEELATRDSAISSILIASSDYVVRQQRKKAISPAQRESIVRGTAGRIKNAASKQYPETFQPKVSKTQPTSNPNQSKEITMSLQTPTTEIANNEQAAQVIEQAEQLQAVPVATGEPVTVTLEAAPTHVDGNDLGRLPSQETIQPASAKDAAEAELSIAELERQRGAFTQPEENVTMENITNDIADTATATAVNNGEEQAASLSDKAQHVAAMAGGFAKDAASAVLNETKRATRLVSTGAMLGIGSGLGLMALKLAVSSYNRHLGTDTVSAAFSD